MTTPSTPSPDAAGPTPASMREVAAKALSRVGENRYDGPGTCNRQWYLADLLDALCDVVPEKKDIHRRLALLARNIRIESTEELEDIWPK